MTASAFSRRQLLAGALGIAAASAVPSAFAMDEIKKIVKNGNIKQSVSRWCYNKIPLDKFCGIISQMGLKAIDLLEPNELKSAKDAGLTCSMLFSHSLTDGLAHEKNHDKCIEKLNI